MQICAVTVLFPSNARGTRGGVLRGIFLSLRRAAVFLCVGGWSVGKGVKCILRILICWARILGRANGLRWLEMGGYGNVNVTVECGMRNRQIRLVVKVFVLREMEWNEYSCSLCTPSICHIASQRPPTSTHIQKNKSSQNKQTIVEKSLGNNRRIPGKWDPGEGISANHLQRAISSNEKHPPRHKKSTET